MLETLEKLVYLHLKEEILPERPLHSNQFASQKGISAVDNRNMYYHQRR